MEEYMSIFLRRFVENKKYITISVFVLLISGFLFGLYQYNHTSDIMKNFFNYLFYLNVEGYENHYQLYLIQNILFVFICTYLSSSYFGHVGILFILFLKGIQLSFSCLYLFSTIPISIVILLLVILEIIIEISLCVVIGVYQIHISLYVTLITFYIEQNFNIKSMMNYRLNCLIASLIVFVISLAFRLYVIPLF